MNGKNGPGRTARESVLSNRKGKNGAASDQERLFKELAHPKRTQGWRKVGGGIEALRGVQVLLGTGVRMAEFRRMRPCDVVKDGPGGSGWVLDVWKGKGGKKGDRKDRKARYIPASARHRRGPGGASSGARPGAGCPPPLLALTPVCWLGKYLARAVQGGEYSC